MKTNSVKESSLQTKVQIEGYKISIKDLEKKFVQEKNNLLEKMMEIYLDQNDSDSFTAVLIQTVLSQSSFVPTTPTNKKHQINDLFLLYSEKQKDEQKIIFKSNLKSFNRQVAARLCLYLSDPSGDSWDCAYYKSQAALMYKESAEAMILENPTDEKNILSKLQIAVNLYSQAEGIMSHHRYFDDQRECVRARAQIELTIVDIQTNGIQNTIQPKI